MSALKDSKRKHPDSTLILDNEAGGIEAWQLRPKSSAIVIVDAHGKVQFLKEGKMSESEIESAIIVMRTSLADFNQGSSGIE